MTLLATCDGWTVFVDQFTETDTAESVQGDVRNMKGETMF